MALRNVALTVNFQAWNTSTNAGETGDSANFTLRLIKDGGVAAAPGGAITEPDSTNLPGLYEIPLTAGEMDADFVALGGISSTANVEIIPLLIHTESGALPNAAPGSNGGLPTVDANNDVAGIQSGGIVAASFASGAIDAAAIAANAITSSEFADGTITAAKFASGAIDAAALNADAVTEIRSLLSGTADSGSTTTLVDAALTEADDYWNGNLLLITSGSIADQVRLIVDFDATGDTITVAPAFTAAVATNTYEILPFGAVNVQQWIGATPNALVAGAVDADVSAIQANAITAAAIANGAIDAATFAANAIDAAALATDAVAEIADGVWDEDIVAAHNTADTAGEKLGNIPEGPKINTAFNNIEFLMVASSDHVSPQTGLTVTGQRSLDGGAFGAVSGSIAEVGNGIYQFDAAAADMNAGVVTFRFSEGTSDDTFITIKTSP